MLCAVIGRWPTIIYSSATLPTSSNLFLPSYSNPPTSTTSIYPLRHSSSPLASFSHTPHTPHLLQPDVPILHHVDLSSGSLGHVYSSHTVALTHCVVNRSLQRNDLACTDPLIRCEHHTTGAWQQVTRGTDKTGTKQNTGSSVAAKHTHKNNNKYP